jgi:type IV secretory pathway VirB4 component
MNDREVEIIQKSIPKRQYYVVSPAGRRLISLGLGGVGLSFVGISSREERQFAEQSMDQFGEDWAAEWLRTRGLSDWAEYLESQTETKRRVLV